MYKFLYKVRLHKIPAVIHAGFTLKVCGYNSCFEDKAGVYINYKFINPHTHKQEYSLHCSECMTMLYDSTEGKKQ